MNAVYKRTRPYRWGTGSRVGLVVHELGAYLADERDWWLVVHAVPVNRLGRVLGLPVLLGAVPAREVRGYRVLVGAESAHLPSGAVRALRAWERANSRGRTK